MRAVAEAGLADDAFTVVPIGATRRFSPPDSGSIFESQGGSRSASAAISSLRSSSQPPGVADT